jgi:hypothetical protein
MTTKPRETHHLPATPRPGDFLPYTLQSRAAARMLWQRRQDQAVIIVRTIDSATGEVLEERISQAEAGQRQDRGHY